MKTNLNTLRVRKLRYDSEMDMAMAPLCDIMNSMAGIRTVESCEGHGKGTTDIIFYASDFVSLAKVQRSVDRRYCGLYKPWMVECGTTDSPLGGHPPLVFSMHSLDPYSKAERRIMERDLMVIGINLKLYHTDYFNEYFKHPNRKMGEMPDADYKALCADIEIANDLMKGLKK